MTVLFTLLGIAAILGVDQLLKLAIICYIKPIVQTQTFLGLLRLHYTENTGAAFSLFSESTALLSVVTGVVLAVSLFMLVTRRFKQPFLHWCITAVTAGGLCNWLDRILRGYVVDYLEPVFFRFAIFNFADCFITVGALLMLCYLFYDMWREYTKKKIVTGKEDTKQKHE